MIVFPIKRLSKKTWLRVLGIWTLAALSMSVQLYLNIRPANPEAHLLLMFLKQLPAWYLCALLTPVVFYFYEKFPLDTADWKINLLKQVFVALLVLLFFSHLRVAAMAFIMDRNVLHFSASQYFTSFLSQVAWDLTIYAFIVIAIFADKNNARRREQELYAAKIELRNKDLENELNNAQLEALKLQLSPHFLFNTLNSISSLVRTEQYSTAIQVNAKLGEFLRTTLYEDIHQYVALEKELAVADLYLDIEKLRFKDRLEVVKEIQRECLQIKVPYFILQPLIENSIKHGISKQSSAKLVSIKACKDNGFLSIIIYNEGKLLPVGWSPDQCEGIGMTNIMKRLEKIYGNHFEFHLQNHENGKGVNAMLKLPVQFQYNIP